MPMFPEFKIGDDLVILFPQVKDALGALMPVDGATLQCALKRRGSTDTPISATSTSVSASGARAYFARGVLVLTADAIYDYDGLMILASGDYHTVGKGSFQARARVTPD